MTDLPLSPDDVAEIVAILDGTPYERIDIRTRRFKLSVARAGAGWTQAWEWPSNNPVETAVTPAAAPSVALPLAADGLAPVRALLPGTFYRSPQPGAAAFVEVGSLVEPDTVVGIIETMKLMTPVHAGVRGTVAVISVANAASVSADDVLLRVAPVVT